MRVHHYWTNIVIRGIPYSVKSKDLEDKPVKVLDKVNVKAKAKRNKRLTWRDREFSDVVKVLFCLLCRHFFVNLTLLRKASLREFENGAGEENLKLLCPAFKRANLEFVNSKKTKKEVCCFPNNIIGLLSTSHLHITCNVWPGIHIYKHYEEREGKGTVEKFWLLFLFFAKYFNHLEKDFDTDNTGDYKGFKKSVCLDQAKNLKTRHFSQSYLFDCHPKTLKRRCLVVS